MNPLVLVVVPCRRSLNKVCSCFLQATAAYAFAKQQQDQPSRMTLKAEAEDPEQAVLDQENRF